MEFRRVLFRSVLDWAAAEGGHILVSSDVEAMVTDADAVVTDTWVSMGDDDGESRHNLLRSYQVDDRMMALARPEAIFMHCLPAHRGDEVTASVIDGPQSVVWDEAENRLDAQKGILAWRSEEHTSELQSLMRISYAVFCLKKQNSQTIDVYM